MKRNWNHFISYGGVVISLTAIIAVISACSSSVPPPSPAPPAVSSQQATPSQSAAPASSQEVTPSQPFKPVPSVTMMPNRPQGQSASGNITTMSGNTLTLSTSQGQVTVNLGSSIPVQETVTGAPSDLQVGQTLIITGNPDSSGTITGNTITIRLQGNQFTPPAGANPGSTNRPNRNGTGQMPNFPNNSGGRGTFGTLAAINGNTLTLTANQGQRVTVNVNDSTIISKTVTGPVSDLQQGQSVTVMGTMDASNNLTANTIIISPQNNSQPSPSTGT